MRCYKTVDENGNITSIGTGGLQGITIEETEYNAIFEELTSIADKNIPTYDERLEALESAMLEMILGGNAE